MALREHHADHRLPLNLLTKARIGRHLLRTDMQNFVVNIVHLVCRHNDCNVGEFLEGDENLKMC
jgi:hypothetical protein